MPRIINEILSEAVEDAFQRSNIDTSQLYTVEDALAALQQIKDTDAIIKGLLERQARDGDLEYNEERILRRLADTWVAWQSEQAEENTD